MKQINFLFLALVLVMAGACTNYDDRFDELESRIDALVAQVAGAAELNAGLADLNSRLNTLESALDLLSARDTDGQYASLQEGISALEGELEALQAAMGGLDANDGDIESQVAGLQAELNSLQGDLNSLMDRNRVFNGDLYIRNQGELEMAQALGSNLEIINGSVWIYATDDNNLDEAAISAITSNIKFILGGESETALEVIADEPLDFSNLLGVYNGNAFIWDSPLNADGLEVVEGNLLLWYDGGYRLPNLKSAFEIDLFDFATDAGAEIPVVGTLEVDFSGLESAWSIRTIEYDDTSGPWVGGTDDTPGAGKLQLSSATSVNIAGVPVTKLFAPEATRISLGYRDQLWGGDGLRVVAYMAETLEVGYTEMEGNLTILSPAIFTAMNLIHVGGDVLFNGYVEANGVRHVEQINLPALGFVDGDMNLWSGPAQLDALMAIGNANFSMIYGGISLPSLVMAGEIDISYDNSQPYSFNAPSLIQFDALTINGSGAYSLTVGSMEVGQLINPTGVRELELTALETSFNGYSLTNLVSARIAGAPGSGQASGFSVDENPNLETIHLSGDLGSAQITDMTSVTELTTTGTLDILTAMSLSSLVTLDLNHDVDPGAPEQRIRIAYNGALESLVTAASQATDLEIYNNAALTTLNLSSFQQAPAASETGVTVFIEGNGLLGAHTPAVAASGPNPYVETTIAQPGIATLKDFLLAVAQEYPDFRGLQNGDSSDDFYLTIDFLVASGAQWLSEVSDDDSTSFSPIDGISTLSEIQVLSGN